MRELQHARSRTGLSVAEVSAKARVPVKTIRRLERNDLRWATLAQLRRIASAVHCTVRVDFVDKRQNSPQNTDGFFKRAQARWVPDLVAMREWKGKGAITRTIVLLVCLDQLLVPGGLQDWLERRRSDLDGESPVGLITRGEWTVLADLIDDMLTGAPT